MRASVIISTYNSPEWLEKVLWGYSVQTVSDFEIIIADDGSTHETKKMVEAISGKTQLSITHVWHKDEGFQKTRILNKAILATTTDYCIFTDGDCIPRMDFVEAHLSHRSFNRFLSGGHFPLSLQLSSLISKNNILNQECFDLSWLKRHGLKTNFKNIKLSKSKAIAKLMNFITTTKPSWNGGNASAWKKDILIVNGFDERMKYGGEDREFGERLINYGIKPKRVRYFAICAHLEHERGYVNDEAWQINNKIREITRKEKKVKTLYGLNLHV
ncbi:glycosyltransferase family 2 protein [Psychroflexus sediminis]|uniref:Glycosyltransferase involved in cell wall bisynthesis n=1 Tax=Psychroflexus sediminis TaxID=470826 RepID=A0A1G7WWT2_9FLAO|nr:glycosyltransferase family 2 protein [Psychroflexus sediminis]SDG76364.1 Glycosyltransferase involved in cell wall bisynthesis [Psychroflexus sediminis]